MTKYSGYMGKLLMIDLSEGSEKEYPWTCLLYTSQTLLSYTLQGVVHPLELEAQFLFIAHVPAVAAAAKAEPLTVRLPAPGGGEQQLFSPGVYGGICDFQYFDFPALPGQSPGHKDGPASYMADALGLGAVAVYDGGICLVFL